MANSQGPAQGSAGAPTQVIPAVPAAPPAPAPRSRGTLTVVALIVAVLALVVGLAGVALSALALGRSDEATTLARTANDRPAPTAAAAQPTTEAPTEAPPTPDQTGEETTSPQEISPSAQFNMAYEEQPLRIRSSGCFSSTSIFADLDEPRVVGAQSGKTDIGYSGCEPGKVTIELSFAQVSGRDAKPADCLETIRTDPGRSPVAPARGTTLCIVTSQNAAAAQGITQKLVFITIDSITRDNDDGILGVTVKAWIVPQ